jgi:hypothetical protein
VTVEPTISVMAMRWLPRWTAAGWCCGASDTVQRKLVLLGVAGVLDQQPPPKN